MSLRDWIDPTRLYNSDLPAGRLNFLWGGCLVPICISLTGFLVWISAYNAWGEGVGGDVWFCVFLPMGFLGIGLYLISATRRLHDLGDPSELSPIVPTSEGDWISYYVRLLWRLFAEPGVPKNSSPEDETVQAHSSNRQGDS